MDKKEIISWLQFLRFSIDEENDTILVKDNKQYSITEIITEAIEELNEPEYIDKQVAINAIKKRKETIKGDAIGEMNVKLGMSYAIDAIEQISPVNVNVNNN